MSETMDLPLEFYKRTGIRFVQPQLLEEALTHSSFINEYPDRALADNQRLEFLGDAVLDFVVGEWLFLKFPKAQEGDLTSMRAYIVRTESLAGFACEIGLGALLRLGKGEDATGGRERPANLCAAFEAVVGALYLDQGIDVVRDWICSFLERHAGGALDVRQLKDAKSRLQEYAQGQLHVTPTYRIIRESGPDHAKIFAAQVLVNDEPWGEGVGPSKQAAEQAAAEAALRRRAHS